MSDSLERLYLAVIAAKDLDPAISRTARLFQRGPAKMAKKLAEEAIEVVIDAVNGKTDAVIRESADLLYNLTVLWASAGVRPDASGAGASWGWASMSAATQSGPLFGGGRPRSVCKRDASVGRTPIDAGPLIAGASGPNAAIRQFGAALFDPFDDADISHSRVAQQRPRGLIRGTLIGGNRARDAVKLDDDYAQVHSLLQRFGRRSSNQVASARGPYRRTR